MSERYEVAISGASFAGLALAKALSDAFAGELKVLVIDRAPRSGPLPPDARAFAVSQSSKRVLERIGAWSAVAGRAEPVRTIEITDSPLEAGVRPVLLTYDNNLEGREPATYIVPAAAIVSALLASAAEAPGVTLLGPAEIKSFEAGGGGMDLTLADGRAISAQLLVAAEGRKSAIRDTAGVKIVGWSYGQTGIVTTVAHERPHEGTAVQHFLPSGPFAILPLPGNRACITWSETAEEARRILALDDASFLAEVEKRFGGRLGKVSLAGPRQSWPLEMHLARSYIAPRLALIGDTAHGVHPIAGQGLNLALRDVAALTDCIADAARVGLDVGTQTVLDRYERWRRFDGAVSAATFDGLNRLFSNDNTLVRATREVGLGLVDRIPALKTLLVSEAAGLTGELPRLMQSPQPAAAN